MESNISKPLDNIGLATPPRGAPDHPHEVSLTDEVVNTMEDSSSCSRCPAMYPTLVDRLSCYAGRSIHVLVPNGVCKCVSNPSHLPLACTHVRGGHVLARADQVTLGQLIGESPGDLLELVLIPVARIDPEAALGAGRPSPVPGP